jgi:hypothetical protein
VFSLRHLLNKTISKTRSEFIYLSRKTMADSVLNSHNVDAIESKSDEPEFDFKEYYSREKTLALRDTYIP